MLTYQGLMHLGGAVTYWHSSDIWWCLYGTLSVKNCRISVVTFCFRSKGECISINIKRGFIEGQPSTINHHSKMVDKIFCVNIND